MIIRTIASILFICMSCLCSFGANIDGTWQGNVGGDIILNLKADGKKLSGIVITNYGDNAITDGIINGNDFSFMVLNNGSKIPYKGKLNGDMMTLTINFPNREEKGELKKSDPSLPTPVLMKPQMTEFYEPVVKVVTPAPYAGLVTAPSDAIILFDGKDLSKWKNGTGDAKWEIADGVFTVKKGTGDMETKESFEDYQLHIEWKIPADIEGKGQARGNSGIFMQGIYELQVLDSYNSKTYTNGQAGSIYKQTHPLVNAMRMPGEWNVYDVIYTAPRFKEDGTLLYPARITVLHNGVLIQNNFSIRGDTPYIGYPKYTKHGRGSIKLQDHGDPSKAISYRNIWLREL